MFDQWTPESSEVKKEYDRNVKYFGEFSTYALLLISDKKGRNLLTPSRMNLVYDIFKYPLNNLTAKSDGKIWSYDDLCQRIYPSYPDCYALQENVFGLWFNQPSLWQTQDDINSQIYTSYGQEIIGVRFCLFVWILLFYTLFFLCFVSLLIIYYIL